MFKDIKWFEWLYAVDEFWNVFSYSKKWTWWHKWKIIKNWICNWYHRVTLTRDKIKYYMLVHRLVSDAFIPNPENKPFVNHKNWIRNDNRVENLEWCTASENWIHSFRVLKNIQYMKWKFWKLNHRSKTVFQYDLLWNFIKEFWSTREVNRILWFSRTGISDCCTWKSNKSNWFIWKYI